MRGIAAFIATVAASLGLWLYAPAAMAQAALAEPLKPVPVQRVFFESTAGSDGHDVTIDGNAFPWTAVGLVRLGAGNAYCTGTVIGPRDVLTAAHCLWNANTRSWRKPGDIEFFAGYRRGQYLARSKLTNFRIAARDLTPEAAEHRFRAYDWAILHLRKPVGTSTGVFPLPGPAVSIREYGLVGYRLDRPSAPRAIRGCTVESGKNGSALLEHDCDTISGNSGSPLFGIAPEGIFVIGVHAATLLLSESRIGLAVPVSTLDTAPRN